MRNLEPVAEQARNLAHIRHTRPVSVLAVTGGKGGVGKSQIAVNMACCLASHNHSVLLLDADLALANADLLLGVRPNQTLHQVINGQCHLEEVLLEARPGLHLVPAASGIATMAKLDTSTHGGLISAFSELPLTTEYLVIDTAAGLSPTVTNFVQAAQEAVVVVCDEPSSITDAYALIKVLASEHGVRRFQFIANMVSNAGHGRHLHERLTRVTEQFLGVVPHYLGHIPMDTRVTTASRQRRPVCEMFPNSGFANAIEQIVDRVKRLTPALPQDSLGFFLERALQADIGQPGALH